MTPYAHAEAYMLMEYTSDDGKEIEYLWNSRDGVTPFVVHSRLGTELTHTNWQRDRRINDFRPQPGSRIFVDMTPERALELATRRVERYWAENVAGIREQFGSKENAIATLRGDFAPSQPDITVVEGVLSR